MSLTATIVTTASFFPPSVGPTTKRQQVVQSLGEQLPKLALLHCLDLLKPGEDVAVDFALHPSDGPDGIVVEFDFGQRSPGNEAKQRVCNDLTGSLVRWCRSRQLQVDLRVVPV